MTERFRLFVAFAQRFAVAAFTLLRWTFALDATMLPTPNLAFDRTPNGDASVSPSGPPNLTRWASPFSRSHLLSLVVSP